MTQRVLSLAEITDLERASLLGAPVFRTVLDALVARHQFGLHDAETGTRLLFYIHEGHTTQPQYVGIPYEDLPNAETVLAQMGGEDALPADALFALGLLLDWSPWAFGDDATWSATARRWVQLAAVREPQSRLFREWRFFVGDAADTDGLKTYIAPEVHARYHGRGAFGDRMLHLLTKTLWPDRPRP